MKFSVILLSWVLSGQSSAFFFPASNPFGLGQTAVSRPSYGPPKPAYGPPPQSKPAYGPPPKPQYGAPKPHKPAQPSYSPKPQPKPSYVQPQPAPKPAYNPPPKPAYNPPPKPAYSLPPKPSYASPSPPSYKPSPPKPAYQPKPPAPQPSKPIYNAPKPPPQKPTYNAPQKPTYNAPKPAYNAPQKPTYNAPKPNPPKPAYKPKPNPPAYKPQPKPAYNAPKPKPSYNSPKPAPSPSYSAPARHYNLPKVRPQKQAYRTKQRPSKSLPARRPNYQRPKRPTKYAPKPAPKYPGQGVKLDYGGWKAIGFDDSLPGKSSTSYVKPDVITVDHAIKIAPPAETDDSYSAKPVEAEPSIQTAQPEPSSYILPQAPEPTNLYITTPSPVILPAYTPSPPAYKEAETLDFYGGHDANPPSYNAKRKAKPYTIEESTIDLFGKEFPIIELITGDSDIPENERYVQFSIAGQAPSIPPTKTFTKVEAVPGKTPKTSVRHSVSQSVTHSLRPVTHRPITQDPVDLSAIYDIAPTVNSRPGEVHSVSGYSQVQHLPGVYQSTLNATNLAQEVSSGSIYVRHQPASHTPSQNYQAVSNNTHSYHPIANTYHTTSSVTSTQNHQPTPVTHRPISIRITPKQYQPNPITHKPAFTSVLPSSTAQPQQQDELYYIYYQDPDKDPLYGKKIHETRSASPSQYAVEAPETLDVRKVHHYAPVDTLPIYDYESDPLPDIYRPERNEPSYEYDDPSSSQQFYTTREKDIPSSHSSVSFNLNVGGTSTGYNYNLKK